MRTMTKTLAAAILTTGLLGIPAVFAQNQADQAPQSEAPMMNDMDGMMQGGGMMGMMSQMNEMMATCTEMMRAMAPPQPATPQQNQEGNG